MTDNIHNLIEYGKISVIVPVYRVEQYLKRCVDSILGQTYKNIELILVDDGSDDMCPGICDSYAKQDSRVRVIHKSNGGLSSARNEGLKHATGNIISLVDSDDYINCNMYSDMMKQMAETDADIVMCDYKIVYTEIEDEQIKNVNDAISVLLTDGKEAQYQAYDSYEKRVTYAVAWNKLYKKELFEGITYPENRIHEDEARTYQLFYRAKKIAYIRYPYYYYFQRRDSIVGKKISRINLQLLDAYIDKLEFYRLNNEKDLWELEAFHSMHMTCYVKRKFGTEKIRINFLSEPQWKRLRIELKHYTEMNITSLREKLEIFFFISWFAAYYKIWSMLKK